MKHNVRYFLGTTTQSGFYNCFENMKDRGEIDRLFIIKGGPGAGKSSLLKRLANYYDEKGEETQTFYCSSDPQSLDGLYNAARKTAFIDGTAPHEVSPRYPGAFESVIELSRGFNRDYLKKHRDQIIKLCKTCDDLHFQAKQYMFAAASVKSAVAKTSAQYLTKRLYTTAACPDVQSIKNANLKVRFLSAISNKKCIFFDDALKGCANTVALCDPYGAAASSVINRFANTLYKQSAYLGLCPLTLLPEHLIMPQNDTAVTLKNEYHNAKSSITLEKDLLYKNMPKETEDRLNRSLNTAQKLVKTACELKQSAFLVHTQIEEYYKTAMDFSVADAAFEEYKDAY